ncbi:hypothetical protein ACFX15_034548 [Malus domestica]
MVVGAISSAFLLYAPSIFGLHGVWLGLTLFMACAQSRLCQISVKIRPVVVRAQGYPDTSASQLRLAKSIRLNGIIRRVTPTSRREVSAANCAFVSIFVLLLGYVSLGLDFNKFTPSFVDPPKSPTLDNEACRWRLALQTPEAAMEAGAKVSS